jgi:hypothetical protein
MITCWTLVQGSHTRLGAVRYPEMESESTQRDVGPDAIHVFGFPSFCGGWAPSTELGVVHLIPFSTTELEKEVSWMDYMDYMEIAETRLNVFISAT